MNEAPPKPERQHSIDVGTVSVYEAWFPPHSSLGARSTGRAAPPRWLAEAYAFIDAHVDTRLSVETIAAHLGIGRRDLSRAFRQHSGTSIRKYVHERLLSRAMTLLRESEM